ncbi:MAG: ATP-grasp domain-containing protein [Chloroflexi bacterium]|nr:ATP-grasp domain-containing protein [Chloroflexota bacterium]
MIRKLLIANRGEIACRIIRTCREMGISTVAVYSDADARALHVERADEAVHIGGSPAPESYLNIEKLITAAQRTGADAVHPGYGFLAENARFAQAVIDAGLIFVGPPPGAIEAMGSKRGAKLMLKGIPIVPGYMGDDQSDARLIAEAAQIGFPVMVKASAGGGGKGMRQVNSPDELPAALAAARREAKQAFGDDTLLLEKVVTNPRHVEVQIFGDRHGNVIALGERECTIQRRHQKIIEETPSTALTPDLRAHMFEAARSIGTQLGYYSAGTVEFLVDDQKNFYFMEMNTRLQVEHPITEETTGFDLVRWQIMVAEGYPLPDMDVYPAGHAIEVRIYAEDPAHEFLPSTGAILRWREPSEVRVDSGVRTGDTVSVYYDPMLAKVIAYGEHRDGAIRRLDHALAELQLLGLRNNIAFLRRVLTHPDHLAGNITTGFIAQHPELLADDDPLPPAALVAAAITRATVGARHAVPLPNDGRVYWRNNAYRPIRERFKHGTDVYDVLLTPAASDSYTAQVGDQTYAVQVWARSDDGEDITLSLDGHRRQVTVVQGDNDTCWVHFNGYSVALMWLSPLPEGRRAAEAEGSLHAPMPGQIRAVTVQVGQKVNLGDVLVILEAMKMEHRIKAPYAGEIVAIHYQVGQSVPVDAVLLELRPE